MQTKIRKWGNSLALRIPKLLAMDAQIKENSLVEVVVSEGKIIARPSRERKFDIKTLVGGITPDNMHGEVRTGSRVGREEW